MTIKPVLSTFPSRILLVIHSLEGGGSERQMCCLANHLANFEPPTEVCLVTLAPQSLDRYELSKKVQRIGLCLNSTSGRGGLLRGLLSNLSRAKSLRQVATNFRPDVVISFCDMNNVLTLFALGARYPVLISERSDPRFQVLPPHWEWLRRRVYPRAKVCVCQSTVVQDHLNQALFSGRSQTKLLTIPSAILMPTNVAGVGGSVRNGKQKKLLFVGRLSPEKQVDKIIEAWASIRDHLPNWKLRIVGSGPLEETWKRLASNLQIANSMEWREWTSDIWHEYETADAFVIASRYEGFPQSLVEAISAGLPGVILDCSSAIRQCVAHEESALIVPTLDDLPKEMLRLLSNETLRNRLGMNAKLASQRFQWDVVAPDWEEAIRVTFRLRMG